MRRATLPSAVLNWGSWRSICSSTESFIDAGIQIGGSTCQCRVLAGDDENRYGRHIVREAALVVEALAKRGIGEIVAELGDDAATDINAPSRAQHERKIAGYRAQNGAEGVQRLPAMVAAVRDCVLADVGSRI